MPTRAIWWVGLGSGLGGGARVVCADVAVRFFGRDFPFDILLINVLGSFAIGLIGAVATRGHPWLQKPEPRHFLMAGFCGGFTTFSFFSLQTLQLLEVGRPAAAVIYSVATIVGSVAAAWLGYLLGSGRHHPMA